MRALPGMHIFRVSEVMTIAHRKHRCYDALPLLRSYEKMLVQHSFVEKSCRRVSSMETLPWRLSLSSVINHRLERSHSGHISSKDSKEMRGGWSTRQKVRVELHETSTAHALPVLEENALGSNDFLGLFLVGTCFMTRCYKEQ